MNRNYANQMIRFRFGEQCQINTSLFIDLQQQKNQFYTKQTKYANEKPNKHEYEHEQKETQVMQLLYTQKTKQKTKMSQNEPKNERTRISFVVTKKMRSNRKITKAL